jgi:hypothetical protein
MASPRRRSASPFQSFGERVEVRGAAASLRRQLQRNHAQR